MMEWLFKASIYMLAILTVIGIVVFIAWQAAKAFVIVLLISPFAAIIVWKINKMMNSAQVKGASHGRSKGR